MRRIQIGRRGNRPLVLRDLREAVLADYRLQERRGGDRAAQALHAWVEHLGEDFPLAELTTAIILEYLTTRMERVARATVSLEYAFLKRGFRLLQQYEAIDPPSFPPFRSGPPRQGFFEDAEFDAVLAELPPEHRPWILFAWHTGWRAREVLGLRWSDVDLHAQVVRLETSKNDEPRILPFGSWPDLRAVILGQRRLVDAIQAVSGQVIPWIFPRPDGSPINSYRSAWTAACKRAGHPGKLVHDLRRTAVRRLEWAGVPRSVAMRLTGHKTEGVYARYAISRPQDLEQAIERIVGFQKESRVSRDKGAR